MASDPERILRSTNPSFRTVIAIPNMSRDANGQVETLRHALKSDNEVLPSLLKREPGPSAVQTALNLLASAELRAIVQLVAEEKAKSIYAGRVNASMTRAVEQVLSDTFRISYKSAYARQRYTLYRFVESVLTKIARREALGKVFDGNMER